MNVGRLNAHLMEAPPAPWGRQTWAERGTAIRSYLDRDGRPVAVRRGPALVVRLPRRRALSVGWLQAHFDRVPYFGPGQEAAGSAHEELR